MKECESTEHLIVRDDCGSLLASKLSVYVITVCLVNRSAAFLCS